MCCTHHLCRVNKCGLIAENSWKGGRQTEFGCAKCKAFYISVGKIGFASVHGKVPFAWHFLDNRALINHWPSILIFKGATSEDVSSWHTQAARDYVWGRTGSWLINKLVPQDYVKMFIWRTEKILQTQASWGLHSWPSPIHIDSLNLMTFHHAILLKTDNRTILIFSYYILSQLSYLQAMHRSASRLAFFFFF